MKHVCLVVAVIFCSAATATPANQGEANTSVNAWPFRLTDTSRNLTLLNYAPSSDTGQVGVPVRLLSALSLTVTGGLTDTQLRASPVPVSGTFWQTTQPVSGTFWQATQPVSGTFWQATQPVSGTVTANAGSGTMAVSGTFWQATQPVSGTVTANAGSGTLATSATQLPAALDGSGYLKTHEQGTATVSGTVTANQGGTWTVQPGNTANTTAWKVDGSAVTQPVSGTVAATESGTWTVQPGNTANSTPWLTTDSATSATASAVPAKAAYAGGVATALGSAPTALSAGNLAGLAMDTQGRLLVNNFHPNLVVCNLLTTATTSTSLAGSCAAPGASKSVWITDVSVGGGVATSVTAPAIIQTGTGGTCGTGTVVLYRCNHSVTAGCEAHFQTPIKASANAEVCIVDGVTGTKTVTLQGFIAP